jgi:hypothetical protein
MFKSTTQNACALCLAAAVTLSVLTGLDLLATQQHAAVAIAKGQAATQQVLGADAARAQRS